MSAKSAGGRSRQPQGGDGGKAGKAESAGVQSAEVAMRVLIALAEGGGEMSLGELAVAAAMPAPKAHRYLASLIRSGFVEQNPSSGHYALSSQSVRVGLVAMRRLDVMEVGTGIMEALRARVDLCVTLSVWGTQGGTIVRRLESSRPVAVTARIGATVPLLRSAAGHVFAAFLPPALTEAQLAQALKEQTARPMPHLPRTKAEAIKLFARVRQNGLGRVSGATVTGINCLAAPVFNADNTLAGVLMVLGASGSFIDKADGPVAAALRDAARAFSERLGADGEVGARAAPSRNIARVMARKKRA